MDANGHILGTLRDSLVDQVGVVAGKLVGINTMSRGSLLAHLGITEVGEVGVIELDHSAASLIQVRQLLLVDTDKVLKERLEGRIGFRANSLTPTTEVHHGWAGNADFGGSVDTGLLDLAADEVEVINLDGLGMAKLSDNGQGRGSEALLANIGGGKGALALNSVQMLEEVDVEISAAELAVGHGPDAILNLTGDDLGDVLVLDLAKFRGGDRGLGVKLLAGGEEGLGAEERSDVVGTVDAGGKRHDDG